MAPDDARRKARSDYIHRRMTQATIALAHGVSEATVGRWKKAAKEAGDDWDLARSAAALAGEGLEAVVSSVVEDFMLQAQALLELVRAGELDLKGRVDCLVSLADAMTKVTGAAGKLAPRISELGVAQDVMRHLLGFVREGFPQHAPAVLEIVEPFAERLTGLYAR